MLKWNASELFLWFGVGIDSPLERYLELEGLFIRKFAGRGCVTWMQSKFMDHVPLLWCCKISIMH